MSVRPEVLELTRRWLGRASGDLRNAEHTLKLSDAECPFETVCFHAQQCVEKSLKAFLTFHGVVFGKSHDLKELLRMCDQVEEFSDQISEVERLSPYAVEARYPDMGGDTDRAEAEQAVVLARVAHELVQRRLDSFLS